MDIFKKTAKILIFFLIGIPVFVSAQLSPQEAISQMTKGINLGNTLEPPYEGEWGNPSTQEYFFDMYKNEGFNCIRIPVRWDKHMATTTPFGINETWFKRVEQILDWGLARGMYIVVNSHHDDWIKNNYTNPLMRERFDSLWSQIAIRFKDKSEKLIFEVLNEPHGLTKPQNDDMHQRIISIIRKTNPTRLIIFQGHNWGGSDELITAAIPNDKYLIGSFHSYDPWPFGLEGTGTFGTTDYNNLKAKFQKVKDWSVKNNIPVFLGEFGGTSKCEYNSRMKQYKAYIELSHTFGFTPCAWDDGGEFRIMNRAAKTWIDDLKDILVNSSVASPKISSLVVVQDTIVKLTWANMATNYDSIFIERRTLNSTFQRVAALKGNTTTFSEHKIPRNSEYIYRVIGHYISSPDLYSYPQKVMLPQYVNLVRKLYTGQPIGIPGKVEAENFDMGGEGFTYHDSDSKNISGAYRPNEAIDIYDTGSGIYLVADNYPGEWLEYTVNVTEKGLYNITAATAAFAGGGKFSIKIGAVESETISTPTTYSWYNTKTVGFSMNLEAGTQIMRLKIIDKPLFNIDYLEFKKGITVGIDQNIAGNRLNIFQNQQELIFDLGMNQPVETVKIYDILGSVIRTIQKPDPNFRISTLEFRPGIYVVQVNSGNQKINKKIIIY